MADHCFPKCMHSNAARRVGSPAARARRMLLLSALLALEVPTMAAQVGHPPRSSPYRDIRKGHSITLLGSYFSGDGGEFNIGPHDGGVFGLRYDIRTGGTIQLGVGV